MPSVRRFDVCVAKPKGERESDGVYWNRIGRAYENEKGNISLFLDALPVPIGSFDGKCVLFEQKERDDRPAAPAGRSRNSERAGRQEDDEIPF